MSLTRRTLLQMIPATAAMSMIPTAKAGLPHRVVVVGGGFAGATVAKYLSMWSKGAIEVTLVEPRARHVSCVMSNLVLNERLKVSDISFDYNTLAARLGVKVIQDRVIRIKPAGQEVKLKSGSWLSYDSLVLAPGIKFDKIPGLNPKKMPHAWIAGGQTNRLRNQIRAMGNSDTFVMSIPQKPYRCPPGPYERACVVADILKRRGGGGKVVVLDANNGIQAEKKTFEKAFNGLYGDIIEYRPLERVVAADASGMIVYTDKLNQSGNKVGDGSASGKVVNVIPRHGAPRLLVKSGLTTNTSGAHWAPVDPTTYESELSPGVYVIGDSQASGQPKSGHMANSQAKVCADAIVRRAFDLPVDTDERLSNITTNSACFSPITATQASWLTAVYRYNRDTGAMGLVPNSLGEADGWNSENYREMFTWSENLFADTFS